MQINFPLVFSRQWKTILLDTEPGVWSAYNVARKKKSIPNTGNVCLTRWKKRNLGLHLTSGRKWRQVSMLVSDGDGSHHASCVIQQQIHSWPIIWRQQKLTVHFTVILRVCYLDGNMQVHDTHVELFTRWYVLVSDSVKAFSLTTW